MGVLSRRHCSTGLGVLALLLLLCGMFWPVAQCAEGDKLLAELKVAYIYNFTGFIEWPEAPAERPFVIGVIGDPAMEAQLRVLERDGKQVGGRRIEVRGYASPDAIGSCEICCCKFSSDAVVVGNRL